LNNFFLNLYVLIFKFLKFKKKLLNFYNLSYKNLFMWRSNISKFWISYKVQFEIDIWLLTWKYEEQKKKMKKFQQHEFCRSYNLVMTFIIKKILCIYLNLSKEHLNIFFIQVPQLLTKSGYFYFNEHFGKIKIIPNQWTDAASRIIFLVL